MSAKEYLLKTLEKEGYQNVRWIEGVGFCGTREFLYTIGLCYGLEEWGYLGRYCYPKEYAEEAKIGLESWNGKVGKTDPVGRWVKHKGTGGEWVNPNFPSV
jgi:hypothetical protein